MMSKNSLFFKCIIVLHVYMQLSMMNKIEKKHLICVRIEHNVLYLLCYIAFYIS